MPNRRKKKLVKPELQLRWTGILVLTTATAVVLQATVLLFTLSRLATTLPNDGDRLIADLPRVLGLTVLLTALVLVPLLVLSGVLATFRLAGPIFRMQRFLEALVAGERPADCTLRQKDDLQDFCALLNRATAPLRGSAAGSEPEGEAETAAPERAA